MDSHFGVKVKRNHIVFSLLFKVGPPTAIYQWKGLTEPFPFVALFVVLSGKLVKTRLPLCLHSEMGIVFPKTGIILISLVLNVKNLTKVVRSRQFFDTGQC